MSQNFYKFSSEEFRWNKLDNIIVGNNPVDTSENAMKMKRLKYTILPPEIYTEEECIEYFNKMDLLIEFLNKYAQAGDDLVGINKDKTCIDLRNESENSSSEVGRRSSSSIEKSRVNSNASVASNSSGAGTTTGVSVVAASAIHLVTQTSQAIALYRKTDARHCDVAKLVMRTSKQGNPNWLYCRYDRTAYTYKSFHLEFHWVVCDSWLIDDMLTLLYRRCQKWGLRLCQVPQYYTTEDLNVHPFRALPYIPVTKSQRESIPGVFPTPLRMVERLLFSRRNGWLFDNEYRTDWMALGLTVPSYLDRDRDLITSDVLESPDPTQTATPTTQPPTPADPTTAAATQPKPHAFSSLSQSLSRMVFRQDDAGTTATSTSGATALAVGMTKSPFVRKSANRKLDRQYVFHNGLAVVRVAAQGFLWIQNTSSKVSDINLPTDERRETVAKNLDMVTEYCDKIPFCYDICIDIVERAIEYAQYAQIANEVIEDCISDAFTQLAHKALQQSLLLETASRQASQESSIESSPFSPGTTDHTPSEVVSVVGISAPVTPKLDMFPPALATTTAVDDIHRSHSQELTATPISEVSPSSAHTSGSKVFDALTTAISFMSSPTESPRSAYRTSAAPSGDYTDIDPTTEPFPHMMSESTDMAVITERAHILPHSASSESLLTLSSVSSLRPSSTASAEGGGQHTTSVFTTVEEQGAQE